MAVYYAGIGSRKAPQAVLDGFYRLGKALAEMGLVLRSGRAEGADSYFERGCIDGGGRCEIYVPCPRDAATTRSVTRS